MIRSLTTLIFGVLMAVLILAVAVLAAVGVIGMATKAALFGEPRATLAVKVIQRAMKNRTVITGITDTDKDKGEA